EPGRGSDAPAGASGEVGDRALPVLRRESSRARAPGRSRRLVGGGRGGHGIVLPAGSRTGTRSRGADARSGVDRAAGRRARVVALSAAVGAAVPAGPCRGGGRRGAAGGRARAAPPGTHRLRALGLRGRAAIARVVGVGEGRRPRASRIPAGVAVASTPPTANPRL